MEGFDRGRARGRDRWSDGKDWCRESRKSANSRYRVTIPRISPAVFLLFLLFSTAYFRQRFRQRSVQTTGQSKEERNIGGSRQSQNAAEWPILEPN